MLRRMCRAKIHRATITGCHLDYEGSIEIDQDLMDAAGILEYEVLLIANLANGHRFETYAIKGPRGKGSISLNGAAARLGAVGNKLIIMSVAWLKGSEARKLKPKFVQVDAKNRPIATRSSVQRGRRLPV